MHAFNVERTRSRRADTSRRRLSVFGACVAVSALILTACSGGSDDKAGSGSAGALTSFTLVAPSTTIAQLPLYVALQEGFYKAKGLDMKISLVPDPPTGLAAVKSGSADISQGLASSVINADATGANLILIGTINGHDDYVLDVGKGITSYADLKGKTVGISSVGSDTQLQLEYLLDKNGVGAKNVTYVTQASSSARLAALNNGQIAGALFNTDYSDQAVAAGARVLDKMSNYADASSAAFSTTPTELQKKGTQVKGFLAATLQGTDFIFANPEKAAAIAASTFQMSQDDALKEVQLYISSSLWSRTGEVSLTALEFSVQLIKTYTDKQVPDDLTKFVDNSYLPSK